MNKNLLIGIVVILLIVGGIVLVKNRPESESESEDKVQTQAPTTGPAMEKSASGESEKMKEGQDDIVVLSAKGFTPNKITISVGDKVVWENKSGDAATVDSDNHPTHLLYPPLNMGAFKDGGKHELVFDKKGNYTYHDHFHPSLKGTVVVE